MSHRERARRRLGSAAQDSLEAATRRKARSSIEVKIDRLVLAGVPERERNRIADAFSNELARALTDRGFPDAPRASTAMDGLDGGSFALERGASSELMGRKVARAVYNSFGERNSNHRNRQLGR